MTAEKKKTQPDKFKELAKQLECDTDEKAFDEKLKKIVKKKQQDKRKV